MKNVDFRTGHKLNCLIIIIIQFMEGKKLSTRDMQLLVNKSIRTCQRYIETLQDLGLPIKFNNGKYYYESDEDTVPFYLTKDKIYVLYLALISFSAFGKDSKTINTIANDVELLVAPYDRKILENAKKNIIVKNRSNIITEDRSMFELFTKLLESFYKRKRLKINYRSKKSVKQHEIEIYGFCLAKEAYYILANMTLYDNIKSILRLDRIICFEELDSEYLLEEEFSIYNYFKDSWEIEVGEEVFIFKLEFYNEAIFNVKERQWCEEQKLIYVDEHKVIYEGKSNSKREVTKWILGYGSEVKVIEPHWLKEEVINQYKKSIAIYNTTGSECKR